MKLYEFVRSNVLFGECELCRGTGTIIIYRNDLEDFEEIECENCGAKH